MTTNQHRAPKQRHVLNLGSIEENMVRMLKQQKAFTFSEIFRAGLRMLYKAEMRTSSSGPSKNSGAFKDLCTPEQECTELLHGEIIDVDGVPHCRYVTNEIAQYMPLSKLGTIDIDKV